jgi:hypothetical protein
MASSSIDLELVETHPAVETDRRNPANGKKSDDRITERAEVLIQLRHQSPEQAMKLQLAAQQPSASMPPTSIATTTEINVIVML